MLKGKLIHPDMLRALGRGGHNSRVLIADGNYPAISKLGPRAELVSLNLSPGLVAAVPVLEAIASAVVIESATVMSYYRTGPYALTHEPPIWQSFRRVLRESGSGDELRELAPAEFYQAGATPDVVLTVQTAEQEIYANLLLVIGVVRG